MPYNLTPPDGTARWAKWRARFQRDTDGTLPQGSTPHVARLLDDPAVAARVQAAFEGLYATDTDVRAVLNSEGVSMTLYAYYLAFGRELWKLTNRVNGQSAALEAATLVAKWTARGLSPSVLATIRHQVFSISAPVGP